MAIAPEQIWGAIMQNDREAMSMMMGLSMLILVPEQSMRAAIERIKLETSIGPMTNPSAYQDGTRFENARQYKAVLVAAAELRKALGCGPIS